MIYIYLAEGFEETEMIAPLDIMRRAGLDVRTVSVTKEKIVTGTHGISVASDMTVFDSDYDESAPELIMLPGGMPGTLNLEKSEYVRAAIKKAYDGGRFIAAICAAPSVLGKMGLLEGVCAVCYTGFEKYLHGAKLSDKKCVRDGKIITAVGMGAAVEFGIEIVSALCGKDVSEKIKNGILA